MNILSVARLVLPIISEVLLVMELLDHRPNCWRRVLPKTADTMANRMKRNCAVEKDPACWNTNILERHIVLRPCRRGLSRVKGEAPSLQMTSKLCSSTKVRAKVDKCKEVGKL